MAFDICFDVNDYESRIDFIVGEYNALKEIDSNNELLKYAGATPSELFWARKYLDEFSKRFIEPELGQPLQITLELNYGMALSEEKDKFAKKF